jgi:hypothetical protein
MSNKLLWSGRILSALVALFLLVDGVLKLVRFAPYVEGTVGLGYPDSLVAPIGLIVAVCTVVYVIPRTAVLGAILLTGYLGGAVATHVRAGDPNFFFPLTFGVLVWLGLFLREHRLRALIPLRKRDDL